MGHDRERYSIAAVKRAGKGPRSQKGRAHVHLRFMVKGSTHVYTAYLHLHVRVQWLWMHRALRLSRHRGYTGAFNPRTHVGEGKTDTLIYNEHDGIDNSYVSDV